MIKVAISADSASRDTFNDIRVIDSVIEGSFSMTPLVVVPTGKEQMDDINLPGHGAYPPI